MKYIITAAALAAALVVPVAAQAGEGGGGSRMPAGGGHMSSYVNSPYHDPRSLHSQRKATGQLLGAPMYRDVPAVALDRRGVVSPNWAVGSDRKRR